MKSGSNPSVVFGFVAFAVSVAIWLTIDTVRALKTGQAKFEWFTDSRTKNPGGFWFNISFRFLVIAILPAVAAQLVFD